MVSRTSPVIGTIVWMVTPLAAPGGRMMGSVVDGRSFVAVRSTMRTVSVEMLRSSIVCVMVC